MMKEVSINESGKYLNLNFLLLDSEEDFDAIIASLIKNFNAVSIIRTNGPGIIVWEFFIDSVQLRLYNDDYGNFIRVTSEEERAILYRIHNQWQLFN